MAGPGPRAGPRAGPVRPLRGSIAEAAPADPAASADAASADAAGTDIDGSTSTDACATSADASADAGVDTGAFIVIARSSRPHLSLSASSDPTSLE